MDFTNQSDGNRLLGAKTLPRVRRFQEHWKEQYPWVYYDELLGKMFCKTCKQHADVCDPASAYFSGGCSNFQLMSLASHAKSKGHLTAEEVVKLQNYSSVLEWEDKSVMYSQASSSTIPVQLYRRHADVTSPSREAVAVDTDVHNDAQRIESPGNSFNIGSSEERIRVLRMAAEEAWRSVGPGSYNVPLNLDFPHTFQDIKPSQTTVSWKSSQAAPIHHAFNTPMRIKPAPKVESVSPQSSDIPVGYPQVVQSSSATSQPQRVKNLCLNAHVVAKKGMSYQDYQWMFELDKAKGCDVGETVSVKECKTLQRCISETVFSEIAEAAKRTTFLSVFFDKIPGTSNQIVYVKTVDSGKPLIHVLSVQPYEQELSLAQAISSAFNRELKNVVVDWMDHCVGLSCDSAVIKQDDVEQTDCVIKHEPGASCVGADRADALSTSLRTKNPQITSLHCSAHMVNIACRNIVRTDYHTHFEKLIACFCSMQYSRRNLSATRKEEEVGDMTCKSHTREYKWISSTLHNVLCVIRNFSTIVDCFKEVNSIDRERVQQNLELLLTQRFVKYIHFLVDMLQVLSHVCHVMTQTTASIGEVYEAICDAADNLTKLKKRSGQQLAKVEKEPMFCGHSLAVDDSLGFEHDKDGVLTKMTTYMTSRVQDLNESTMTAMTKLVCLAQWPTDPEHLKDYADEDLLLIVDQFAPTFQKHGLNTDKCLMEWSLLKNHIRRRFTNPCTASWEIIYPACKSKCENMLGVLSFILTLPGQSIDRGRVYSYFEKLPGKWKENLPADEIKHILRIFLHTPDVGDFDPCNAVALYCDQNQSTEDQPIRKKLKTEKSNQWSYEDDVKPSMK